MFNRIGCTWKLMGASLDVLKGNKQLLVFPILSGLASLLVIASFVIPAAITGFWELPGEEATTATQVGYYSVLFAFYVCNYFVILFFNSALITCAISSLRGDKISVSEGLRVAVSRIGVIFGWSLVSATVSVILRIIEQRSARAGKIISSLLGTAWTITTFLVLPVLIVEKKGPVDAFKRSALLLKQTWGEQLIGGFSFGLLFLLLSLPAFLLIGIGVTTATGLLMIACVAVAGLYLLLLTIVQPVLHSIFRAALYLYAVNGEVPSGFTQAGSLQDAINRRQ